MHLFATFDKLMFTTLEASQDEPVDSFKRIVQTVSKKEEGVEMISVIDIILNFFKQDTGINQ